MCYVDQVFLKCTCLCICSAYYGMPFCDENYQNTWVIMVYNRHMCRKKFRDRGINWLWRGHLRAFIRVVSEAEWISDSSWESMIHPRLTVYLKCLKRNILSIRSCIYLRLIISHINTHFKRTHVHIGVCNIEVGVIRLLLHWMHGTYITQRGSRWQCDCISIHNIKFVMMLV